MKRYFEGVYIINLPSRVDRRDEMQQQLKKLGLYIDGSYVRLFPAVRPMEALGFPTIGTRGCFLSHLAVLKDATDRGLRNVLILEDDCNFRRDISVRMEKIFSMLHRSEWGFFYGGALNSVPAEAVTNGYLDSSQEVMGAHFLAISSGVMASVVSYLEAIQHRPFGDPLGGPMHVDGAYSWFRSAHPEVVTFLANPEIAYQRSSETDIHKRKWYEYTRPARWILQRLRRVKNIVSGLLRF